MKTIKKGIILVCTRDQSTGCGIRYLKKGSIVKCAAECPEWRDTVEIYRNETEMAEHDWKPVSRNKLRQATPEEEAMYYEGKYFLETAKV